ncbi:hypothetical protein K457DRAFT_137422 [Linnemannia elongata AG-77]|uniref:Uncharacterized protein n=1 Tax=Linnemannia elongata AG-77 TaxID=1314771 RepID=A0A197JYB1_9FUNG|nr:hypothetical protein K457DRAFT_137422 [Linnemannia elongata AG-77]
MALSRYHPRLLYHSEVSLQPLLSLTFLWQLCALPMLFYMDCSNTLLTTHVLFLATSVDINDARETHRLRKDHPGN